jgi:hypothetical protein
MLIAAHLIRGSIYARNNMSFWHFIKELAKSEKPKQINPTASQPQRNTIDNKQSPIMENADTIKISGRPYYRVLKIGERCVEIFADIYDEERTNYWIAVQEDNVRYLFSPDEGRWSYHGKPTEIRVIEEAIFKVSKDFSPALWNAEFKTVYRREGKTVYSIRGEAVNKNGRIKVVHGRVQGKSKVLDGYVGLEAPDRGNNFSTNLDSGLILFGGRLNYMEGSLSRWITHEVTIMKSKR